MLGESENMESLSRLIGRQYVERLPGIVTQPLAPLGYVERGF